MEKRSVGRQIWEIVNPILTTMGITFVVEAIILSLYFMQDMPELMEVATNEELFVSKLEEMIASAYQYMVEITAIASLVTIPVLMFMRKRDARKDKEAGIVQNKKASWYKYFLIAGVSVPLAIVANNIITLSNLAEYSEAYQEATEALFMPSLPVQLVCLGIITPICEELVFRGLRYKRMRRDRAFVSAMISSALVFGVYHMNLVQMIYATICGLLLAYLYEKYGSLKAPMLAHILMNVVVCVLSDVNAFTWMFSQPIRMALITIVCAAIGSSVFLAVRRIDEKPDIPETVVEEVEN